MVSNICYFYPYLFGEMIQFDLRIFFQMGGEKPPTTYTPVNEHSNGKSTICRCISYWKRWISIPSSLFPGSVCFLFGLSNVIRFPICKKASRRSPTSKNILCPGSGCGRGLKTNEWIHPRKLAWNPKTGGL